ncbi:hypothetical protein HDV00_009013 [Rhizophlyctis rosea]|nr:hypothetical protein HDV00_009013 [Rhizophlyctis rosea]
MKFITLVCLATAATAASTYQSTSTPGSLASCLSATIATSDIIWKNVTDPNYLLNANGERIFRPRAPLGIVLAKKKEQVRDAVKCARRFDVRPTVRSGGHSYEALSSLNDTLIIDLSTMYKIDIDKKKETVTVSPGIRLGNLYTALYEANPSYSFTAGVCPTVGLGGHLAAGGYGMLVRKHGLAIDNAIQAQVVLADGSMVTASATKNKDLWFAIRGGGGNSYGIVVEWTLQIIKVSHHYSVNVVYDVENLHKVLPVWGAWVQGGLEKRGNRNPDYDGWDFDMQLSIDEWSINLMIHYTPDEEVPLSHIETILTSVGLYNNTAFPSSYAHPPQNLTTLEAHATFYGGWDVNITDASAGPKVAVPQYFTTPDYKEFARMKSDYISGKPSPTTLAHLGATIRDLFIEARDISGMENDYIFLQFEPYGGKMSTISSTATAFPHRAGTFTSMQYGVYLSQDEDTSPSLAWMYKMEKALKTFANGSKYQGYVDLDFGAERYYGKANLEKLKGVKGKWDPEGVFWSDLVRPESKKSIWFGDAHAH